MKAVVLAGGQVYLNKDIVVCYYPRNRLRDLFKLYFRYGGARAGFLIKHRTLTSPRQLVPPLFLAANIILPVVAIFDKRAVLLWLALVGIYLTTDLMVSLLLISRPIMAIEKYPKSFVFLHLFFAFPIIHCSWASGFWKRLVGRSRPGTYWKY